MKRKVILEGELGDIFGRERELFVESFSDLFRLLECNFPKEFKDYFLDCHEKDIGFICQIEDNALTTEEELLLQYPEGTMIVTPAPAGSKGGVGRILAAIAIVVVVAFAPFLAAGISLGTLSAAAGAVGWGALFTAGLTAAAGTVLGAMALGLAVNLALSGIAELLAPDPSVDKDESENFVFQGAEQGIIEGDPVPILYGKLRIPGRPISFDIRNATQSFYNYNRNATSQDDTGLGFVDSGAYSSDNYNAAGADINHYIRNLEQANQVFNQGGFRTGDNPPTELR